LTDKSLSVLIPGCGNAYEAYYLHDKGFTNITLVDISEVVTNKLKRQLKEDNKEEIRVVHADFFSFEGSFDLILEQTFFCALHPSLRESYVEKMNSLLSEKGKIAGVMFNRDFEGGPPFGGHISEYEKLFAPVFHIRTLAPCYNSIPPRAGAEAFVILEKKKKRDFN
jgi:methyl halide transferase